ncbi:MAG: hypothetical protein R3E58_03890 [Phycisphaerae bacterium]
MKRHLKLIAALLMLGVAAFLLMPESSPYPPIPERFDYVCVSTGEMFNLSIEKPPESRPSPADWSRR